SQHVGGFVISEKRLTELVPIENAAMPERRVIQWEKDDLEALGLMKVDVLALGMLTAIRKALKLIGDFADEPSMTMVDVPREDPAVYGMMQRADTVGVFQIESRAQMSMLPRLRPECYYDLVIQIAIVRPGPIQGDMVHPYLARRAGREPVTYPSESVRRVLERTLGIPIFQEQVMQFAIVAADYTPGEADQLRRDMAAWKRKGGLEPHRQKLFKGLRKRGYADEYAQRIFEQIKGFGDYGFPESHSASFAHLAYVSSWLKHYHPAAFACALINSWPMGFYRPDQLVQDARRHDVQILPVDVNRSEWDCSLEPGEGGAPALRLGLRMVKGLSRERADVLYQERVENGPFDSAQNLATRTGADRGDMESLAAADALRDISGNRHAAFWRVSGLEKPLPLLPAMDDSEPDVPLRKPHEVEDITADYRQVGLTLRRHPLAVLRDELNEVGVVTAKGLWNIENDRTARAAGVVIGRQRPGTASGVIFVTLEDETGQANVIVWPKVAEAQRQALLQSGILEVTGQVQKEDGVLHLIARKLRNLDYMLPALVTNSRDFH
ncbi:MAG: OB-fold nucleic acid binding domain-containing protein, partial [Pseudomonadota bacterium]